MSGVLDSVRGLLPDNETTSTPATPNLDVSLDELFDVLGNSRRRHIIQYLSERRGDADEEAASKRELAGHIASIENKKPTGRLTAQERKRVYISLHQCHLDVLDDAGVVTYNEREGVVVTTTGTDVAATVLEDANKFINGGDA